MRQDERLERMTDAHTSIARADGSVGGIDPRPSAYWLNGTEQASTATPGRYEYRGDQLAGVGNSQQPVSGEPRCGGLAGRLGDLARRASGCFTWKGQ
jgi:hypothetical protein